VTSKDTDPIMKKYAMQSIKDDAGTALYKYMLPQVSGSPVGFHFSIEKNNKTKFYGSKEYFFKSQCYMKNNTKWPVLKTKLGEHVWVARDEIGEYLKDDDVYLTHVTKLL